MRPMVLVLLAACGTDVRPSQPGSDPGVDGGGQYDGGGSTAATDARVPPPSSDGSVDPSTGTPCEQAVSHSDFAFIQDNVFTPSCALAGCHAGAFPRASLDLTAGRAYGSLVGVASTQYTGWTRVVPDDSPASLLMVLTGAEAGPDQGTMPWGQPKLCPEMLDAMKRWIVAGAPP